MGIAAAIIGIVGAISGVLGVLRILNIPATPIINNDFTYVVWFWISALLLLGTAVLLLARRNGAD